MTDLSVDICGAGDWLRATLASTTAPTTVSIEVDPAGLPVGTYGASVEISSPVAENGYVSIGVYVTVADGLPDLTLGGPLAPESPVPAGERLSIGPHSRLNQGVSRANSTTLGY